MPEIKYQRVLLKISGESLKGSHRSGIDNSVLTNIAAQIRPVVDLGVNIAIVVGGGLIRSNGGWSAVNAMRRLGMREKADARILVSGEFVEQLIKQMIRIPFLRSK